MSRTSDIEAYNVGFSGTTWTDHGSTKNTPFSMNRLVDSICAEDFSLQEAQIANCSDTYKERFETLKSIDFSEVDYITIFYGTNDWNSGKYLTSAEDPNTENKQRTNVEDSIKYCISKLKEKFPHIEIVVISPYWLYFDGVNPDTTPNKNGVYLEDYVDYIASVASTQDVAKVINLYRELNIINMENYLYYLYDGVHPNNRMSNILASVVINVIHALAED